MKTLFKISLISLLLVSTFLFVKCDKDDEDAVTFSFPLIENINTEVYNEIKKTCETYWDLNIMIDTTFEIIGDGDEFSVHCDGIIDGQFYHFVIRTDKYGKWINDGRSIMTTSVDFLDVTYMMNYGDFENIKTFILSNGDRKTLGNMFNRII